MQLRAVNRQALIDAIVAGASSNGPWEIRSPALMHVSLTAHRATHSSYR